MGLGYAQDCLPELRDPCPCPSSTALFSYTTFFFASGVRPVQHHMSVTGAAAGCTSPPPAHWLWPAKPRCRWNAHVWPHGRIVCKFPPPGDCPPCFKQGKRFKFWYAYLLYWMWERSNTCRVLAKQFRGLPSVFQTRKNVQILICSSPLVDVGEKQHM
jgi:hypothetical protein